MFWLLRIELNGLAFSYSTKAAMPSADIAAEHERCGSIRPAFKNIGATRLLADSMKTEAFNQLQHLILIRWISQTNS
jgi:hypothetical protein